MGISIELSPYAGDTLSLGVCYSTWGRLLDGMGGFTVVYPIMIELDQDTIEFDPNELLPLVQAMPDDEPYKQRLVYLIHQAIERHCRIVVW